MSQPTQYRSFRGQPFQAGCTQHNNGTVSLTFTKNPKVKQKTQKRPKPKIVRTRHYFRAD